MKGENTMKTAKLVCGIIAIVLFIIIMFQSCAAGMANAIDGGSDTGGGAGFIVAFLMLIGGIVGITTRASRGGGITAGIFFLIAGLIGTTMFGIFGDLQVWGWLSLIFAAIYLIGSFRMSKNSEGSSSDFE